VNLTGFEDNFAKAVMETNPTDKQQALIQVSEKYGKLVSSMVGCIIRETPPVQVGYRPCSSEEATSLGMQSFTDLLGAYATQSRFTMIH
jgi:hypothetical protein